MSEKLLFVCTILCLDLLLFVLIYEESAGSKDVPASTTFYENIVALTFDDGPHSVYTKELLDGLKKRDVVASFFVLGEHIEGNEELILRMKEEGHLIGNHTFSHVKLDTLNDTAACDEVKRTCEAIESITGEPVEYIRPPYGAYNDELECMINLNKVLWSVDPQDWNTTDIDSIVNHVVKNVKDRDIILLHDIYPSSVAAALRIVDELKARGYIFVTVEDILIN
jgi:peptidoglycan-N-acetylglucosamine deacetylase